MAKEGASKGTIPAWAHYRKASERATSCATCSFFDGGECEMFNAPVEGGMLCDKWLGTIDKHDYQPGTQQADPDVQAVVRAMRNMEPLYIGKARRERPAKQVLKGQANPAQLRLHVVGVHNAPGGQRVYRVDTRDGHYVGRTNPTTLRAVKGDVIRVQANHFAMDAFGNLQWDNPNCVAHYSDRADSWKQLEALAGGSLSKDGAPGEAGDIPAANDIGAASAMPSGPTLAAVHINAPMPNISVAYAGRDLIGRKVKVVKAEAQQLVYGVVLEPNVLDSQDDFMLPAHVEKAAHNYLKKAIRGKSSVAKLQHRKQGFFKDKPSIVPVESFVAPVDFSYDGKETIKKGSWVLAMHVEDANLWQDFLNGKYTGFSVGGSGIRQSYNDPGADVPHGYIDGPDASRWIGETFGLGLAGRTPG